MSHFPEVLKNRASFVPAKLGFTQREEEKGSRGRKLKS